MLVKDNSTTSINTALLSIEDRIKLLEGIRGLTSSLQGQLDLIKKTIALIDTSGSGIIEGETYNINISGNAASATTASEASHASTSDSATEALSAITATSATTASTATSATSATKATQDGSGNVITDTYMLKSVLNDSSTGTSNVWSASKTNSTINSAKLSFTQLYSGNFSTSNSSITLSDSINNYSAVLVIGTGYGNEQAVSVLVPKSAYFYKGSTDYRMEYIINGSIGNSTRRIYFGFLSSQPKILYTGEVSGASGNLPRIKYVFGIK